MIGPRFTAKRYLHLWGVYDRVTASWPSRRVANGDVLVIEQDHLTETHARAEADRLNGIYAAAEVTSC